jgi:4-hydroxy-3-polyprenylbenzoate decarboxylase
VNWRRFFKSRTGTLIPKILVLGDDIDPASLSQVMWALATRCHAEHGTRTFHEGDVLPLVGYLTLTKGNAPAAQR